jgi:site-specific DNA-methyltransferase (cytosine-N4-specific)
MTQLTFLDVEEQQTFDADEWTFNGASTRQLTHCYHDYPARMIPQIAGKLLDRFDGGSLRVLFDPYCGTGTSLVEGTVRGISVIGTDLNPLARLIATAKVAIPDEKLVSDTIQLLRTQNAERSLTPVDPPDTLDGVSNLGFWFKPEVVAKLAQLRNFVSAIDDDNVKLFFEVAFSETAREASNTRKNEFKLYRYAPEKLNDHNPDVYALMLRKLNRNSDGLHQFAQLLATRGYQPNTAIHDFNTVQGIPATAVAEGQVDIVITSPPYGDSHTTVAYGQYSRLSAAWLGLAEPQRVDTRLMGGKLADISEFSSNALNEAISRVADRDEKRAREVSSFYDDLHRSITNIGPVVRRGGWTCYVVGNRKVKGNILPTDAAVQSFFEEVGFDYVCTFQRSIPNKRMPLRNSPTNAPGEVENTMHRESIVVMRKR